MTTDQQPQPNKSGGKPDLAEALRNASSATKTKAKLLAAIGVIRHSKLPDDMVGDFAMALVESVAADFQLAALEYLQIKHNNAIRDMGFKAPDGVIMSMMVAAIGLKLVDHAAAKEDRLRGLSAMFDGEVSGPPIIL